MSAESEYKQLTRELITIQEELIEAKELLNTSNKKYHETKVASMSHVEYKNLQEKINILTLKEENIQEKRSLLK